MLPIPFKAALLKELIPLREIYLDRRAPRICIAGDCIHPLVELIAGLGAGELTTEPSENGWTKVTCGNKAEIFLFDSRIHEHPGHLRSPLIEPPPDFVLVFSGGAGFFSHSSLGTPRRFAWRTGFRTQHRIKSDQARINQFGPLASREGVARVGVRFPSFNRPTWVCPVLFGKTSAGLHCVNPSQILWSLEWSGGHAADSSR